jgi:replicative DNA helicase
LSNPDLYWDEIVSIEPAGKKQVYDLTVPDGSNFIAQDIIVHNTSWALNVALHAAVDHKVPVAIFSLEMSKEQLVERLLCAQAKIDSQRMHRGLLSEAEHERLAMALGPLGDAPIFIDESPSLDELTVLLKARQIKLRENIGLIVLDYLQLMQGRHRGDDANRVQEVSQISRSLKALARELKVPVLAISQLSRAPEQRPDKRPILSDLRESGSLEQDADVVLFIFRPEYYKPEEKPGMAEVIVAKHRNGPTGTVELIFRRDQTLFYNPTKREAPEQAAPV